MGRLRLVLVLLFLGAAALVVVVLVSPASAADLTSASKFHFREVNITQEFHEDNDDDDDDDDESGDRLGRADGLRSSDNLAVIYSLQTGRGYFRNDDDDDLDLIATIVSTIGAPTMFQCFYLSQRNFTLDIRWHSFLAGDPKSVDVGHPYFCLGYVMQEIIEYIDTNQNGRFDIDEDDVVYKVPLDISQWRAAEYVKGKSFMIGSTSIEEVISVEWSTPPSLYKERSQFIMTPNMTKWEIRINDFPFRSSGASMLALGGAIVTNITSNYLLVENKNDATVDFVGSGTARGYFHWAPEAMVEKRTGTGVNFDFSSRLSANISDKGLINGILGHDRIDHYFYVSFFESTQPSDIAWDSSVGYGDAPSDNQVIDILLSCFIALTLVVPSILISFSTWHRCRKEAS